MKTVIARPGFVLRWFAGPLIWAAHFLVVYGSESLACTRGGSHALVVIAATIVTLGALAATTALAVRRSRASGQGTAFMDTVAVALGFLSITAVLAMVLPAFLLSACMDVA